VVEYVRLAKVFAGSSDPEAMDVPGVRVKVYDDAREVPVAGLAV
jgi:hypothetical protein